MLKQAGNGMHVNAIGAIIVITLLLAPCMGRGLADVQASDFALSQRVLKRRRTI